MTGGRQDRSSSLRDLFHREIEANGGNPSAAFIAVLDRLDRHMAHGSKRLEENARLASHLSKWLEEADGTLAALPSDLDNRVSMVLRRALPEMAWEMEEKAATGAREGAKAAQEAMEALKGATEALKAQKRRLAILGAFMLPLALFFAVIMGMLLGNLVIPALPKTWQWPCMLIGAEYRTSAKPLSSTTFCVIERK